MPIAPDPRLDRTFDPGPARASAAPYGRDGLGPRAPQADGYRDTDYTDWPTTQPPTQHAPEPARDLYAEPPEDDPARKLPPAGAIVPAGSVTGSSLTLVIAIMCFLACLTAGAVYMMNQSATAWLRDIASEVTVQIEPRNGVDMASRLTEVTAFLGRQPGIASAAPLSLEASRHLLEPWLGGADALGALPLPRLIAVEVTRSGPAPDIKALGLALAEKFPGTSLDDHRQWQRQIQAVTRTFALGGLAILLLVGAATMLIIVSATRSAMLSNREIVEVLHFVGATDRFIAREFERHFLALGVRAGLVGAGFAMLAFFAMPSIMQLLGSGTVTLAEFQRLVGSGTLDGVGYLLLGAVVVVIAGLCMITSRLGVYRILHSPD